MQRLAPGALKASFDTLMRRLGLDPWLFLDTTVQVCVGGGGWGVGEAMCAACLSACDCLGSGEV